VGLYGGYVQAGVGFTLTAALADSVRYDWVRSNTLRLVCEFVFTGISLMVFIWDELVCWLPGSVLVAGNMVGALAADKILLNISQNTMKRSLFVMTLLTSVSAWLS